MLDLLSEKDLAYYAGFFDGEGSICIVKKTKGQYVLEVTVTNTYYWILESYALAFGGSVGTHRTREFGRKPCWRWAAAANIAHRFLSLVLPYLEVKKYQAEIAIQFQEARIKKRTRSRRLTDAELALQEVQRILVQEGGHGV